MSIREKIILSFIVVIFLLVVSVASVFFFHVSSISEYKKISNALILENTLTELVSEYMEAYTALSVAPLSQDRVSVYIEKKEILINTFVELDTIVVDEDSKVAYRGLKNIILSIIKDLENARIALNSGDIVGAGGHYDKAVYKKPHVGSNATLLVLKELTYLHHIQDKIEKNYSKQLLLVLLWIVAIIFITTLYALLFARKITMPIKILSQIAQKVSQGNYSLRISKDIHNRNDEVGMLGSAFNVMLDNLNEKITQVEKAHTTILANQNDIEQRNSKLEKFNTMVINRELRMVELKEQNRKLLEQCKLK